MAKSKKRPVPLHLWPTILNRVRLDFDSDQVALVAGGVAFYWLLALFPALATGMSVVAMVAQPDTILQLLDAYGGLFPPEIVEMTRNEIHTIASEHQSTLSASAGLWFLTSMWVALAGIRGIISGINVAWDLDETRNYIRSTFVALGLLLLGLGVLVIVALFFAALPILRQVHVLDATASFAWVIRWPTLAIVMMAYLSVMYRVAPCRKAPPRAWITPGSVIATLIFLIASAGFSYYAQTFAAYNDTYGSLSNGVVLLLWFWLSAIAVLIGAETDAEIEKVMHPDKVQTLIFDRAE